MPELVSRLRRLEIAFDDNAGVAGAQAEIEEGVVVDGAFLHVRTRTVGLDAGGHPEYGTTIAAALGDVAAQALSAERVQRARAEAAEKALEEEAAAARATGEPAAT